MTRAGEPGDDDTPEVETEWDAQVPTDQAIPLAAPVPAIQSPEFLAGLEVGRAEGRKEGRRQGVLTGRADWRAALRFCLLRTGTAPEDVEGILDKVWAWGLALGNGGRRYRNDP